MFSRATSVEAGFFDFLDKIFGSNEEDFKTIFEYNSQTALLLEPVLNSNPMVGDGGGGPTIVNGNALLSVVGPNGSMADIEESVANSDRINIYVVREGDNLSQIAKMFDVSSNTIIWANDIEKGDLIKVGQTLIILPITGLRYEVKTGDTISSVAKKFNASAEDIERYNDLTGGKLAAGDIIVIPDGEMPYSVPSSAMVNPPRGSGGPVYSGYYIRPIDGGIKTQGLHGYNGVDLASYCGAPIYASASGDVIISRAYGWNGGYGNYVVISHQNGTQTLYAHLSKNIVSGGWHVVQGQVIGYEGTTGKSSGCHVHFEIRGARNPF